MENYTADKNSRYTQTIIMESKPHWFKEHEENDLRHFALIEEGLKKIPSDLRIKHLVMEAFLEAFETTGKRTKAGLYMVASIIVALGIITGAFKAMLALFFGSSVIKP